jgi:phthalate 4,5-dioxygenase oxygenase subunit
MLSEQENELLTHVGPGTPMGTMMRRFWVPALLAEEVAEPDGTPVRVRLLGEDFIVFRDTAGKLGFVDAACPHRLASLGLGRNEEGGLRCIYHGWKFGVDGKCLDMPTEPPGYNFADKVSIRSYPTTEIGDMVWVYLGPPDKQPRFPAYDWLTMPREQRAIVKQAQRSNYLQGLEGSIDSAHSWFLHRGSAPDWQKRLAISADTSPRLEAEDTDYGFRYAAIRRPQQDPDKLKYVRVTLWALPFAAFIPRPIDKREVLHVAIHVPIDDHHTMFYGIFASQDGTSPQPHEAWREKLYARRGIELDERWMRLAGPHNGWNQDRNAMKDGDFSGINGFPNEDMAVQESMGHVVDRTREHLGTSDVAIIRMRRRMTESLERSMRGEDPIGLHVPVSYERMRSEQRIIPIDEPWQQVGAFAGEYPVSSGAVG